MVEARKKVAQEELQEEMKILFPSVIRLIQQQSIEVCRVFIQHPMILTEEHRQNPKLINLSLC